MSFLEKLESASARNQSRLCVGLDPDPDRLPDHLKGKPDAVAEFTSQIVSATQDLACTYKPNFAFFGALGAEGFAILERLIKQIPRDIPVILDFKAGDIGNTAERYAAMAYDRLGVDATTVNPYMGEDAVRPFTAYADRCAFLLCLTSNPGSADFQRLEVDGSPLYESVARKAVDWSQAGTCGLVVGATHPEELGQIRKLAPELPFLIPGVGSQGGDVQAAVMAGTDARGGSIIVNASRSILYASRGPDFAEAARQAAESLRSDLADTRPVA
jgi:orotidine-5'-phosphate decarboxylase